ncbi:hypothetical protein C900_05802 [Fulvivirga imtechensis AK7]|uniref:Uncharacterized protein n=1 Tax=Fulvivirga imtechensis AK7 TaxID=1237149 RepID=L8JMS8_9BACT|nr:hypothetical protein [Fulvivirga imtechensis]ELR68789.1 hypothetical protein C900_05802 [Fulvivirga imtechensis AK7]
MITLIIVSKTSPEVKMEVEIASLLTPKIHTLSGDQEEIKSISVPSAALLWLKQPKALFHPSLRLFRSFEKAKDVPLD